MRQAQIGSGAMRKTALEPAAPALKPQPISLVHELTPPIFAGKERSKLFRMTYLFPVWFRNRDL